MQCKINYEYDKRRKTPYCRLPNSGNRGDEFIDNIKAELKQLALSPFK